MTRLLPFNRQDRRLLTVTGFEELYNMINNFFSSKWRKYYGKPASRGRVFLAGLPLKKLCQRPVKMSPFS